MDLLTWAGRWNIPVQALAEYAQMVDTAATYLPGNTDGGSEEAVQNRCRLRARAMGGRLDRNNVGALQDKRGAVVRFGLCNDTPNMNEQVKSSDLIGLYPLLITPEMVGQTIGQYWAVEVKHGGWSWNGDAHEQAQLAYGQLVRSLGGRFSFVNSEAAL